MLLSLRSLYEASGVSNGNALRFDNTASGASYFQFTGPALPNADWCVGYCIRPDNRSETSSYQYTVSVGTLGAAGSLQLFMPSVGSAAATPFYVRHLPDQGGTEVNEDGASLTLPRDGSDWWFIIQRRASVYETFAVRENTTAVVGNSIPVVAGSIASKTWRIGGRTDNGANRWLLNPLGEFFVLTNDSLTASEITTLATGKHITEVRTTRAVDLRFRANNSVEPDLSGNGRDATRFGTAFTLVDPFFNETGSNTAPVAVNDSTTTPFQTVLNFDPRTNDTDAQGNSLSVNSATLQSGQGSVTFNASGISYVPGVGFSGTAVIAYTVTDGSLTSNTATVTVTVLSGSNNAPVAVNDSYSTAFQTQLVFDPRTNDTDADGNPITVNGATLSTGQGSVSFTSTSVTYTPGAGFSGTATINYTITDGSATSNSATITITVASVSSTLTFNFNQTNGTTLEAIDPRWAGDSTGFYTSNGVITSNTPWTDVTARFEASQGDTQKVQAIAKAGGFAGGQVRGLVLQSATGQDGYVFTIQNTGDAFNFVRNGTFIANWTGASGQINSLTNDVVLRAEYNHVTGVVRLYANDILAGSYTDTTPLLGGYPGLRLYNGGTIGSAAFDDWTDLSTQGAVLVRALTISSDRYAMLSSGQLGQGIKPLVMVSGQKRLRAASEGVPLVIGADGLLRTLASNETLEI